MVMALVSTSGIQAVAHHPALTSKARKAVRRQMNIPVPDFSLTDQTGRHFRFQKLRGKLIVLTFVYTTCPDACPLITSSLQRVQTELSTNERKSVFLLSITTDPEIDKPQVLKSYAERYGIDFSNWSFLTGEEKELSSVWKAFGVKVERKARGLVDHTTLTALVDEKGGMRFVYHGSSPDSGVILQDLRALLNSN
jgi:protein SCO1/2